MVPDNSTKQFMRTLMHKHTSNPMPVIGLTDPLYLTDEARYKISVDKIDGKFFVLSHEESGSLHKVNVADKSITDIVADLNSSPFRIVATALGNATTLGIADGFLLSGNTIPESFPVIDRSIDGGTVFIRATKWSVHYDKLTAIGLENPSFDSVKKRWWPRIAKGSFTTINDGIRYEFGMPEYDNQTWSSIFGKPFVDVPGEVPQFLKSNIIQVSSAPILAMNNILIKSIDKSNRFFPASWIKDVDVYNGIIYLEEGIKLPEEVEVFYTYLEKSYVYKHINVNAHFKQNPYLMNKFIVFYARPISSSDGLVRSRGIYHQVGHTLDQAIYSIKAASASEPIAILGALAPRPIYDRKTMSVLDTRSYGGGLNENELGIAHEQKFNSSEYFTDIGRLEGIPYGGSASVLLELPPELKETMSVEEIQRRAKKFLAAGVYPVIRFDEGHYKNRLYPGVNPDISFFDPLKFAQPHWVHAVKPGYKGVRRNECGNSEDINGMKNSSNTWIYGCIDTIGNRGDPNDIIFDGRSRRLTLDYAIGNPDGSTPAQYIGVNEDAINTDITTLIGEGCIRKNFYEKDDNNLGTDYPLDSYWLRTGWEGTNNHNTVIGPPGTIAPIQTLSCFARRSGETAGNYSTESITLNIYNRLERITLAASKNQHKARWSWSGAVPVLYSVDLLNSGSCIATDAGNGWYRFSITYTGNTYVDKEGITNVRFPNTDIGDVRNVFIYPSDEVNVGGRNAIDLINTGAYIWGVQMENTDLTDYQPVYGDPFDTRTLGYIETAQNWINSSLELPRHGLTGNTASNGPDNQTSGTYYNVGRNYLKQGASLSRNSLVLEAGNTYEHVYLRSSPNPTFSWEERTDGTQWTRKTYKDTRIIPAYRLAAGKVSICSEYARKYVRNIKGSAVYQVDNINDGTFVKDLTREIAQIWTNVKALSPDNIGATQRKIIDVAAGSGTAARTDVLGTSITIASTDYEEFQFDAALNKYTNQWIDPFYKPFLQNLDTLTTVGLYTGDTYLESAGRFLYQATSGEHDSYPGTGTFPKVYDMTADAFIETDNYANNRMYDAIHDIYTYSKALKDRVDFYSTINESTYSPAIKLSNSGDSWINGTGDALATYLYSGLTNTADRVNLIHNTLRDLSVKNLFDGQTTSSSVSSPLNSRDIDSLLYSVYYDAAASKEWKIRTGVHAKSGYPECYRAEIATDLAESYLAFDYVKAFATLYATQISPTSGDFDVAAGSGTSGQYINSLLFQPRDVAISGMLTANQYFSTYYEKPHLSGESVAVGGREFGTTWLYDYTVVSRIGAKYLENTCEAFENIYFGNRQWAGWLYSSPGHAIDMREAPYYKGTAPGSPTNFYRFDSILADIVPTTGINWIGPGTGVTAMSYSGALCTILSGIYKNTETMRPTIYAASTHGGILEPGYVKAVRKLLWLPYYSGQNYDLWTEAYNPMLSGANFDVFVETFELGMSAILRGAISEQGIITEGGSFKHQPAPMRTALPSELFKACADAIRYYDSIGDTSNKQRWSCLAEGVFRNTTGSYKVAGGYPDNTVFNSTSAAGNVGCLPVDGMLYLLQTLQTESFSTEEKLNLTGDITTTLSV